MAIITDTDLNNAYGATNVDEWADLNGDADATHIAARRTWAIDGATADFYSKMRKGRYIIPIADEANSPADIKELVAGFAGLKLYFSRGNVSTEAADNTNAKNLFSRKEKELNTKLNDILAGKITVDLPVRTDYTHNAPYIYKEA